MSIAILDRRAEDAPAADLDNQTELIAAAQSGDRAAFAELYRRHAPLVQRMIKARIRDQHRAEELAAEVFARALNKLHTFQPRGIDFSFWLLRIGINLIVDEIRSASNRSEIPHAIMPEPKVDDFGKEFVAALDGHMLRQALDELSADHRRVLEMRFLEERTPAETAKAMGKTHSAIRVLQYRAIGAMKRHFAAEPLRGLAL